MSRISLVQYSPRRQSRWMLADYGGIKQTVVEKTDCGGKKWLLASEGSD